MRKRKLKISLHRIRETKELRMILYVKVCRKKETSLWYTFFYSLDKYDTFMDIDQ